MTERTRMDVYERFDRDPAFRGLVDFLTAWIMQNPTFTPTELREAAMVAATRAELYVNGRSGQHRFMAFDGTSTIHPMDEAKP